MSSRVWYINMILLGGLELLLFFFMEEISDFRKEMVVVTLVGVVFSTIYLPKYTPVVSLACLGSIISYFLPTFVNYEPWLYLIGFSFYAPRFIIPDVVLIIAGGLSFFPMAFNLFLCVIIWNRFQKKEKAERLFLMLVFAYGCWNIVGKAEQLGQVHGLMVKLLLLLMMFWEIRQKLKKLDTLDSFKKCFFIEKNSESVGKPDFQYPRFRKTLTQALQRNFPQYCTIYIAKKWIHYSMYPNSYGTWVFKEDKTDSYALHLAKQQLSLAKHRLQVDELTQLFNRKELLLFLRKNWEHREEGFFLFLLDLDHFKQFNDQYGHLKGDACLIDVAQTIRSVFKNVECVPCRYGGEEFAILLRGIQETEAWHWAEKLRIEISDLPYEITCSVGFECANHVQTIHDFFQHADIALYAAKTQGRDRVQMYKDSMTKDESTPN